jgi:UDP-hydrolysing UDP-N-acetyl-D-glucosamine 2-epimerase
MTDKARRRVLVVTGTRAEYGILYWVLRELGARPGLDLGVAVTGAHLSPDFGLTYREIEADGFRIDARVEMLLSSDSAVGVGKSLGLGVIGFAEALDRLRPDLLLLVGDRYEMLAAAQAALFAKIPVAHLAGGDTTEGAYDEAMRHAITKMAHLHFVTNADAARRVRQLGEDPAFIHLVGSPGIDFIKRASLLDRPALEAALGFRLRARNLLVTFHPATLERERATDQFGELLRGLDLLGGEVGVLLTKPNADVDGRVLSPMIDQYVARRPNCKAFVSMGHLNYLSAMAQVDVVVGNSSSGLYEAPSFGRPTVNVGDRQRGRLRAASVVDCPVDAEAIAEAVAAAFVQDCRGVSNPYGDGDASRKIADLIVASFDAGPDGLSALLKKRFQDLP